MRNGDIWVLESGLGKGRHLEREMRGEAQAQIYWPAHALARGGEGRSQDTL